MTQANAHMTALMTVYGCEILYTVSLLIVWLEPTLYDFLLPYSVLSSLLFMLGLVGYTYHWCGRLITPALFFLISFYLFQNGHLLLDVIYPDFNSYYIDTLRWHIRPVAMFSALSTSIVATIYARQSIWDVYKHTQGACIVDTLDQASVRYWTTIGFIVTMPVALGLAIFKFHTGIVSGYEAVRQIQMPFLIQFIEYMFVPFYLLYYIYCPKTKLATILFILWCGLTTMAGLRTVGMGGLVLLCFLAYQHYASRLNKLQLTLIIGFTLLSLMMLIVFVSYFRVGEQGDMHEIFNPLLGVVTEMGFNTFSLFTIMEIFPDKTPHLGITQYLYSMIGGVIPASLDPTGTIAAINESSRSFEQLQDIYYPQYTFGLGFSLNAEAYMCFGWYGLIAIAAIATIVFRALSWSAQQTEENRFRFYTSCILLYFWFTLPRRDSYYIWKAITNSLALILLYYHLLIPKSKRE